MEYIDKKALRNALFNGEHNLYSWEEIEAKIDAILADDVAPVRRGEWKPDSDGCLVCSECGNPAEINGITGEFMESPYCSECGAKME